MMPWWKRYGLRRRLKRGDSLLCFLTFRCTLRCDYCAMKYIDGKWPHSSETTLSHWKRIIKSFPRRIREIKITGGEPMLMPYFTELVNWLLDEGYFVLVITNLTIKRDIKQSDRLLLVSTLHEGAYLPAWKKNLKFYLAKHRIKVDEIERSVLKSSKTKDLCYREYGDTCTGFIYSPEGRLFTHVNEMYENYI